VWKEKRMMIEIPNDVFKIITGYAWNVAICMPFFVSQVNLAIDARESIPDMLKNEWMFTGHSIVASPWRNFTTFVPSNHLHMAFNDVIYTLFLDMKDSFFLRNRLYKGVILKKIRLMTIDIRNLHYWNEIVILLQFIEEEDVRERNVDRFTQIVRLAEPLTKSSLGLQPFG
jgi:hypothetical protein